jgi:hypothetical protein
MFLCREHPPAPRDAVAAAGDDFRRARKRGGRDRQRAHGLACAGRVLAAHAYQRVAVPDADAAVRVARHQQTGDAAPRPGRERAAQSVGKRFRFINSAAARLRDVPQAGCGCAAGKRGGARHGTRASRRRRRGGGASLRTRARGCRVVCGVPRARRPDLDVPLSEGGERVGVGREGGAADARVFETGDAPPPARRAAELVRAVSSREAPAPVPDAHAVRGVRSHRDESRGRRSHGVGVAGRALSRSEGDGDDAAVARRVPEPRHFPSRVRVPDAHARCPARLACGGP